MKKKSLLKCRNKRVHLVALKLIKGGNRSLSRIFRSLSISNRCLSLLFFLFLCLSVSLHLQPLSLSTFLSLSNSYVLFRLVNWLLSPPCGHIVPYINQMPLLEDSVRIVSCII